MCKIIFYKPAFKKKAMDAIVVFKKKNYLCIRNREIVH